MPLPLLWLTRFWPTNLSILFVKTFCIISSAIVNWSKYADLLLTEELINLKCLVIFQPLFLLWLPRFWSKNLRNMIENHLIISCLVWPNLLLKKPINLDCLITLLLSLFPMLTVCCFISMHFSSTVQCYAYACTCTFTCIVRFSLYICCAYPYVGLVCSSILSLCLCLYYRLFCLHLLYLYLCISCLFFCLYLLCLWLLTFPYCAYALVVCSLVSINYTCSHLLFYLRLSAMPVPECYIYTEVVRFSVYVCVYYTFVCVWVFCSSIYCVFFNFLILSFNQSLHWVNS